MRLKQAIVVAIALLTLTVSVYAEDKKVWAERGAFVTTTLEETQKLYKLIQQNDERAFSRYGEHLAQISHAMDCDENQEFFLARRIENKFVEVRPVGSPDTYYGFSVYFSSKRGGK